jgi:uncharacterized protein (TIGR00290 family)
MHNTSMELMKIQAQALNLPLYTVTFPKQDPQLYGQRMANKMEEFKQKGIYTVASGDIFLEDSKNYREKKLKEAGITALFPLWKRNTKSLMVQFIEAGFKSVIINLDTHYLNAAWLGRTIDKGFMANLAYNVDPCGENGEYHSFVYDGPNFQNAVQFSMKNKRHEGGIYTVDTICQDLEAQKRTNLHF